MCFNKSDKLKKPFKAEKDLYVIKWGNDISLGKRGNIYFTSMYKDFVYIQSKIYFPDKELTLGTCDELAYRGFHSHYNFAFYRPLNELILGIFKIPECFAFYADEEGNLVSSAIIFEKEFEESDLDDKKYNFNIERNNEVGYITNTIIENEVISFIK